MKDIPKDLMINLLTLVRDEGLQCELANHLGVDKYCDTESHKYEDCIKCANLIISRLYEQKLYTGCKVLAKQRPFGTEWEESIYAGYQTGGNGVEGGHYCTDDMGATLHRVCGEPIAYEWEETKL